MKKIASNLKKLNTNHFEHLKNIRYVPILPKENSFFSQDHGIEYKYTKIGNKIIKEIANRQLDDVTLELTHPQTKIDEKAFNYFTKQDLNVNHTSIFVNRDS